VVNLAINEYFTLIVSDDILTEYEVVLRRPKLKLAPREAEVVLKTIKHLAIKVVPTMIVAGSRHEVDNRFLECAQAGEADYVVTGNKRHFPQFWGKTVVVNAREFLELIVSRLP
jgi:putative PIN family toxin of toxin-antitoxin system